MFKQKAFFLAEEKCGNKKGTYKAPFLISLIKYLFDLCVNILAVKAKLFIQYFIRCRIPE